MGKLKLYIFCVCLLGVKCNTFLNLNGEWRISNTDKKYNISGDVPGGIYTALIKNNIIGDPFYRDNDIKYRWIARENWTYSRKIYIEHDVLAEEKVVLVAEGLDTVSTIYINGQPVGRTDNMFITYTTDVTDIIQKQGFYSIDIAFQSALDVANKLANQSYIPSHSTPSYNGFPNINFLRKMQYSFSWDWGPAFPSQGIWKNIYLQIIKTPIIQNISALPHKVNGNWSVDVEVNFETSDGKVDGIIEFLVQDLKLSKKQITGLSATNKVIKHTVDIPPDFPLDVWWPNGYGNQTLYNLTVIFLCQNTSEISVKSRRFGFRTVELVEDPVSNNASHGLTFYYKINDVPIFLKGSNWIPSDMFLERITPERTRRFLQSAVEVHVNAMRMNGVGIYEEDYFYDLTDELGIMIIQDFMFSDAVYPVTNVFLNSVKTEITQQMKRIKHHPSIIGWALNNENEELIKLNWFQLKNISRFEKDYVTLYINTVRPIMLAEDDTRPWIPSSPSNGVSVEKDQGWFANNSALETFGDIHFYDYISDLWNVSNFRTPRFAAEFGLQSWCNFETIEPVFEDSDFDYWSNMSVHRQHHPLGNEELIMEAVVHMNLPNSTDVKQQFKDLIYVTQIEQAMGIRTEVEHYRRYQNQLDKDGKGITMGALYWQLVDVWQAPTWSSIDYDINWKMLHYYARHFLSPKLISPYLDGDNLNIFMVTDEVPSVEERHPETQQLYFRQMASSDVYKKFPRQQYVEIMNKMKQTLIGTVIMEMYNWSSFTPIKTWNIPYQLDKTSGLIFKKTVAEVLNEAACFDQRNCFLYFYINAYKSPPVSTSWLTLNYFRDSQSFIPKAKVVVTDVTAQSQTQFTVTLATNNIAPFVWINAYKISGRFSDNGFLMKDPLLSLTFTSWQPIDLVTFKKSLTVKSFMDIYH
ncbi:hypothetical protein SNE40_009313 [Patella caerulea]|uniref:beta-mannosidase n=1 Tax=Patella caerulea TaxID=87958 RepID=A0AAN8PQH9_PATCE